MAPKNLTQKLMIFSLVIRKTHGRTKLSDTIHVAVVEEVLHGLVGPGDVVAQGIGLLAGWATHPCRAAGALDGERLFAVRAGYGGLGLTWREEGHGDLPFGDILSFGAGRTPVGQ